MSMDSYGNMPLADQDVVSSYGANTPPSTDASSLYNDNHRSSRADPAISSVPWPGFTYTIRSVAYGTVITVREGQVVLTKPGSGGSYVWECVETKGWLGFRNTVTGKFLGHTLQAKLVCSADRHKGWENFTTRTRPEGGSILLMTHWENLWPLGIESGYGADRLVKIGTRAADGLVWEFVKIG